VRKAILVQGTDQYLDQLHSHYQNYKTPVLYSLWNGTLGPNPVMSIWSQKPNNPGYGNSNLQFEGALAGCQLAEDKGIDYLLKIRADMIISNPDLLMDNIDPTKLSVLAYHNWDGGYYIDYAIGLPVNLMTKVMDEDTSTEAKPTERQLMERYAKHNVSKVDYLLPLMKRLGIACHCLKWKLELVSYAETDPLYIYPPTND